MLVLENLRVHYNKVEALKSVSMHVDKGEIVSVIGSNGAGKTTLLKTITGLVQPSSGTVMFDNERISCLKPHAIVGRGVSMVPEGRGIFANLSVEDNLLLGGYSRRKRSGKSVYRAELEREIERFPILKARRKQSAGTLSGGEQQMLTIARGLMAKPKLLLLDEPSLGLAPFIIGEIFSIIENLRDQGATIVLVEQMASHALAISNRAYVLEIGKSVLEGSGKELLKNPDVKRAYLGG